MFGNEKNSKENKNFRMVAHMGYHFFHFLPDNCQNIPYQNYNNMLYSFIVKRFKGGTMKNLLRQYCLKQKISFYKLEKQCHLANGSIGKWYSGKVKPSFSSLEKIQKVTGIPVGILRKEWV